MLSADVAAAGMVCMKFSSKQPSNQASKHYGNLLSDAAGCCWPRWSAGCMPGHMHDVHAAV